MDNNRDLKHLSEKCKRHESSYSHLDNSLTVVCSKGTNNQRSSKQRFILFYVFFFKSIQADEKTDIATQSQLVLVLCYIDDKHSVQERVFEFIPLQSATSKSIATALRERLAAIGTEKYAHLPGV